MKPIIPSSSKGAEKYVATVPQVFGGDCQVRRRKTLVLVQGVRLPAANKPPGRVPGRTSSKPKR